MESNIAIVPFFYQGYNVAKKHFLTKSDGNPSIMRIKVLF